MNFGPFIPLTRLDELQHEQARAVELAGASIALFRIGDEVHALDDFCPHSGGPLSDGALSDGCVTCPWHGARFELATGRSVGEFTCHDVRRHATRVVDGAVEIALALRR